MKPKIKYILIILTALLAVLGCERDTIYREVDGRLAFSEDTVFFDTIFTTIGSATRRFKVYNNYSQSLEISSIELAGGERSVFRLNIDGLNANSATRVEVPPKDSLYIFVEVTLDPNNVDSIMLINDSIVFNTNGNVQDVNLMAWGQDVHMFNRDTVGSETWFNDKPYLVRNYLLVDTLETLTVQDGVRIYMHRDAWMVVKGSLKVRGTLENPVSIQGDRLEYLYRDIPGQWGLIYFAPGSRENEIEYMNIRNGVVGLWADTVMTPGIPNLTIRNTRIDNMSAIGLMGQGTSIHASNTSISNCGQVAIFLNIGGSYEFYHCTVGNYWNTGFSNRTTPSLAITNYYEAVTGEIIVRPVEKAYFGNCIIWGNREFELIVNEHSDSRIPYLFDHCLLKADPEEFNLGDESHFVNVINLEDPRFVDYENSNLALDTLSPAKDVAGLEVAQQFPLDIEGISRLDDPGPDIGAFERVENDSIAR